MRVPVAIQRPTAQRRAALVGLALAVGTGGCAASTVAGSGPSSAPASSASASAPASAGGWPSAGQQVTVVGLGDSVMESANCACAGPVQAYATLLQARTGSNPKAVNLGSGGLTAADLAQELTTDQGLRSAVHGADVVLLTIGANDVAPLADTWQSCPASCWAKPLATLRTNLDTVLSTVRGLRKNSSVPVLVTNYWNVVQDGQTATSTYGTDRLAWSRNLTTATNKVIEQETVKAGETPVDLVAPFLGSDNDQDPTDLLLDDGDHPNAKGVEAIARAFLASTRFG